MKKKDFIIIVAIFFLILLSFAIRYIFSFNKDSKKGQVIISYQNKKEIYKLTKKKQIIVIDQGDGMVNEICIENNSVYMKKSSCKNQLCVKQGKMTPGNIKGRVTGRFIVCLPHKLTVELKLGG